MAVASFVGAGEFAHYPAHFAHVAHVPVHAPVLVKHEPYVSKNFSFFFREKVDFGRSEFDFIAYFFRHHPITVSNMEFMMLIPEISNPNTKQEKEMLLRDITASLNLTVP